MRTILLIIPALLLGISVSGQQAKLTKEQKQEMAAKKKAEKEAKIDSTYKVTEKLLESQRFTLQADYLRGQYGNPRPVTQLLNFISVDSLFAVVQIGSNQRFGANGVGGVTSQGPVTNWKLVKNDKKKTFDIYLTVTTNYDVFDIIIYVSYDKRATATLTAMRPGRLTWDGYIYPLDEATIFKGQSH